jgi:N-acetylglutamate synthase-like GNAT family acetyltransferase
MPPMTGPTMRRATADDAGAIAELVNRAFEVERFFAAGDRTDGEQVRRKLERGDFLLAEEGGALIGCVYLEVQGDRGTFGMLSVSPLRQRSGLGRLLVEAAESHFRAAGCHAVDIQIVNLRTELPPYYRALGYAESGTAPFPPEPGLKRPVFFVRMSKPLRS